MKCHYRSYEALSLTACLAAPVWGVSAALPNSPPAPTTGKPLPATSQEAVTAPVIPPAMLTRIHSLRPGMTRADLAKLFLPEGGFQVGGGEQGSYVYRFGCAEVPGRLATGKSGAMTKPVLFGLQVKIDVTFAPAYDRVRGTAVEDRTGHRFPYMEARPDDVIATVSQPYTGPPNDN